MKKVLLISLLLGITIAGILSTKNTTQGQQKTPEAAYDEPTLVITGQSTKREKDFSKEYKKLYPNQTEKITKAVNYAKERNAKEVTAKALGIPTIPTIGMPKTALEIMQDLFCKADVVVLGEVKNRSSHLTEDETWIYTEYNLSVEEVIKDNTFSPIEVYNDIQITRPGGTVKLDGVTVQVIDRLYDQLEKNKKYLLFLKYVPSTQGYLVSDARGDFVLQGNRLKSLSNLGVPSDLETVDNYQSMLTTTRNFALEDCSHQLKGGN